jgi:hypothetical protein
MQFTTLTAFIASLALTATAAPAELSTRQGTPRVRATFFNDGGCGGAWADDFVFVQNSATGLTGCQNVPFPRTFPSTYFNESLTTKTCEFFKPG